MTTATRLLALDQGTSSSRAILFDADGGIVALAQREFDGRYPHDGWVEHDPEILWQTTLTVAREVLDQAGVGADAVAAIGITNQRETTLLWDRSSGEAVYPAIVWQDRRTASHCERIRADGMDDELAERTGLVVDPYFSATKLAWLLDQPGVRARAERGELAFGTVDTFLMWRLSGGKVHRTDATNASRTQLFNLTDQAWDTRLLEYFGIPQSVLPEVVDSSGELAHVDARWLGAALPVTGVAGDQQAALVGQACFAPGQAKSTYGTGCFAMVNTGPTLVRSGNRLLGTVGYRVGGQTSYALEGSIFVAGSAIKWLRDALGLIATAADSEAAARRVGGDAGGVYVVPAFTGLGAPYWDADARGAITGLTLAASRDHIVTATLQAMAYQSHDLLAAMAADGAAVDVLRVDGGMVANDWLCQYLADILDREVARPRVTETTAWGAAVLAGLGAGVFGSLEQATGAWQPERVFAPAMDARAREAALLGWRAAVSRVRTR